MSKVLKKGGNSLGFLFCALKMSRSLTLIMHGSVRLHNRRFRGFTAA